MDLMEAIEARHSVRAYLDKEIEPEKVDQLQAAIDECNAESGLHIQLVVNDGDAFKTIKAGYGVFSGLNNYFALVGEKGDEAEQKCGYYGEKLVLLVQQLGLNTCWIGGSYSKRKTVATVAHGEKIHLVIAVGYGETQGKERKTKPFEELCTAECAMPEWFRAGVKAAMLAPTALNQQKFNFKLEGNTVTPETKTGFFSQIDLGIAKYHFEAGATAAGANPTDWHWA